MDRQAFEKIAKRHIFQVIQISFLWVTAIGIKLPSFFLFKKSQQIRSLETFKILAEMGRGGQAI